MAAVKLAPLRLLDPREPDDTAARPIADAVNIPLSELPRRAHELPPKMRTVHVAATGPLADDAVAWLRSGGRRAEKTDAFQCERTPPAHVVGRLWEPNSFLAEVSPELNAETALDLACGTGRDAVFMASCGWDVTAVDILPDALERARDLARRCAAAIRPIRWLEADLESGQVAFDTHFDLIVVVRYLHRPLLPRLAEWLRPGGSLIYETFTTLHRARHGKPTRDTHVLQPGELPRLLEGCEVRHHSDAWREGAHTARVWAVRPKV